MTKMITLRINDELVAMLDAAAQQAGVSRSYFLINAACSVLGVDYEKRQQLLPMTYTFSATPDDNANAKA